MHLSRGVLSLLTVALIFLVVGGAVAWRALLAEGGGGSGPASELPETDGVEVTSAELFASAQPVSGVEVIRDTLRIQVVGSGEAEANRRSVVATRRDGVVERVFVRENDVVQAGAVLIQLDTLEAAMALDEAQASLTSRQNEFEAGMIAGGDIADPELLAERERNLRARVGLIEAESQLRRARMEMERTRVTAPFAGRVADLQAVEGEYLGSGAEVLTLVQLDPIKVRAEVLESDLIHIAEGARAWVRFTALPEQVFEARVESINPIVNPDPPRAGRVTLTLSNPEERIRPGMYARATLDAQSFPDRILVPRQAILERDRREVVFMFLPRDGDDLGVIDWRYVTTGLRNDTHVEILPSQSTSVPEPGEIVLVDGHHFLGHDGRVRLTDDVLAAGGLPGR